MNDAENWGTWKPEIVDHIDISEDEMEEYKSEIDKIKKQGNDLSHSLNGNTKNDCSL